MEPPIFRIRPIVLTRAIRIRWKGANKKKSFENSNDINQIIIVKRKLLPSQQI